MSCCGQGRLQAAKPRHTAALRNVVVEYIGTTSMVVVSPVTGRRYSFAGPGARLDVDGRDRAYLMGIPHLRALV